MGRGEGVKRGEGRPQVGSEMYGNSKTLQQSFADLEGIRRSRAKQERPREHFTMRRKKITSSCEEKKPLREGSGGCDACDTL